MNVLKTILILTTIFFSQNYKAQDTFYAKRYKKLFLIEDLSSQYNLKKYNLNAKELYGINKQIELYNFFENNYYVILFSVFQNTDDDFWVKVDYDLIKDKIVVGRSKMNIIYGMSSGDNRISKSLDYGIVKKIGDNYYIPAFCLTEFFSIREYEYPLTVRNGTINIKEKPYTISEMQEFFKKNNFRSGFPIVTRNAFFDDDVSRIYLSKTYDLKSYKAYQFWTFDWWNTSDNYNIRRGIDRFVYIPEMGIVGGSFDFYFSFHGLASREKLWDNIINEKVMIAEELK